jgi:hypothetical protein
VWNKGRQWNQPAASVQPEGESTTEVKDNAVSLTEPQQIISETGDIAKGLSSLLVVVKNANGVNPEEIVNQIIAGEGLAARLSAVVKAMQEQMEPSAEPAVIDGTKSETTA